MIYQMHVIHTRGACRHTGQAGQAAIYMFDRFLIRDPLIFQHILNQIDSAARAVQLITQNLIGGTCRSAKAAVDTAAQNIIGAFDLGISELRFCEMCLHQLIRPGFKMPRGSNFSRRV